MSYEELLFGGGTTEQAPPPQVNPLALNFGLGSGGAEEVGGYGEPPAQRRRTEDGAAAGGAAAAAAAPAGPGQAKCFCNYCQRDITDRTRIKCAECLDFDLCPDCFSVGVEIAGHKNDHGYRVTKALSFPVYSESWSVDEEERLLEGMAIHGYGNWNVLAEHVGTKDATLCKAHYYQTYLDGSDNAPLPMTTRLVPQEDEWSTAQGIEGSGTPRGKKVITEEMTMARKRIAEEKMTGCAGYIRKRNEFETEWYNECETVIGDMEFTADDTAEDVQLKLKVRRQTISLLPS